MKTVIKKIVELDRAHYNPRVDLAPGDPRYEKLKKSISEFGLVEPIVWNMRTNRVVGGHQRLTIMGDLGNDEVPVSVVDLDEDQEKALNLALNKTGGDWDKDKLADILQELDANGFDIEITGFAQYELDVLVNELQTESMQNASWLDDIATRTDEDDDHEDHEPERNEPEDEDEEEEEETEETVAFKVPVTVTQREIILEAIKRVKLDYEKEIKEAGNEPTTQAALTYICQLFVEGKLRP